MYLSLVCCSITFLLLYNNNFSLNSGVWGERNFANAFSAKPKKNLGVFCSFRLPQIYCAFQGESTAKHMYLVNKWRIKAEIIVHMKIRAGLWLQFKRRECNEWEGGWWTIDFVWMRLAPIMGASSDILLSVELSSCFLLKKLSALKCTLLL